MNVDVIIPVYRPGEELFQLLDRLEHQSQTVSHIILMNTEKRYWDALIQSSDFEKEHPLVQVFHVTKEEFDHGKTRREGVEHSTADMFVMMTQDAIPADDRLIENLTAALSDEVAVAYGRQLAGENSGVLEQISRQFNYPAESMVKSLEDKERLGIKTFFCSDVCAAYVRKTYDELGGFVKSAIFNEDMIYASNAIEHGYKVAYVAPARVFHSHNYTIGQQLHRNFDLGVSQAMHPEVFGGIKSESEGKKLVKAATHYLKENHMLTKLPYFYMQCAGKYVGYLLGKHYKRLPRWMVLRLTSNRSFWK